MPLRKGTKSSRKSAPPPLHELESEVMEELWKAGESSVRTVMESLNKRAANPRAYTTYMTIMARLNKKASSAAAAKARLTTTPRRTRARNTCALRAQSEIAALVDQYGDVALSHFAQQMAGLDPARRRALQREARRG